MSHDESPPDLPWRAAHIRQDMRKQVLTELPEDYVVALRWLREQRAIDSQRALLRDAAIAAIDERVRALTGHPVRDETTDEGKTT